MDKILKCIEDLGEGKYVCYKTRKVSLDVNDQDILDYDDKPVVQTHDSRFAESDQTRVKTVTISKRMIEMCKTPLFAYFLDGSRHIYKVDDMAIGNKIYPVMAGQIIVGCCKREDRDTFKKCKIDRRIVLCLPITIKDGTGAKENDLCKNYCDHINQHLASIPYIKDSGILIDSILLYKVDGDEKFLTDKNALKDSGTAKIQDEMVKNEQDMVAFLCQQHYLDDSHYLIKDGSLEYREFYGVDMKSPAAAQMKTNFQHVVGVSKMFNPDLMLDYEKKKLSKTIATLPPYTRTKVYRYKQGTLEFAVWYLRLRNTDFRETNFSDVVKCEMMLSQQGGVIETDLVNIISANLIREAYPTCHGKDSRWGNHLYPVFLTESFCKANYISQDILLNLF